MGKDDSVEVYRINARVMKDDLEGYIAIAGNQGTVFLREGGNEFKVIKETILTDGFEVDVQQASKLKDKTRKLKEGELLECLEWPKKEEKSGLTRMRCKVKSDGVVGWVTSTGNQGTVYLEVV